ncbi:MAG: bifunctional diaminohydroxyphosphoribosylaminopyrimidine deaminase/5-amino-6-(5-phosphoribosylamino)uracil reductase RibD [Planctomycetota bacterium]
MNARNPRSALTEFDRLAMTRAFSLAKRGEGRVEPNPMVGCVIARDNRIIAEGYHRRFGGAHAEIEALRHCRGTAKGATAYVTLEPCCHYGKTPPCSQALIQAGVRRVVCTIPDPNPAVDGGGIKQLQAAGIEVACGVFAKEAAALMAPFLTYTLEKRPYCIAKWAQTLDGKLATETGDSKWISNEASRKEVHRLRARVDAILVGVGTVIADNPRLTARDVSVRRLAVRIVLDPNLRISPTSHLVQTPLQIPTWIFTTPAHCKSQKAHRLLRRGVEFFPLQSKNRRWNLPPTLQSIRDRGITNLLIEGGPITLRSFLEAGVLDEAFVYTSPILFGGEKAPTLLGGPGVKKVRTALSPTVLSIRRIEDDILHHLRFTNPERFIRGRRLKA